MSATFAGTAESLADELGAALDRAGAPRPEVALVLGSGLGALADTLEDAHAVPFTELPSMPASTVPRRPASVSTSGSPCSRHSASRLAVDPPPTNTRSCSSSIAGSR